MSWLGDLFGTSNIDQNFNYNPAQINTGSVSDAGTASGQLMGSGQSLLRKANSFMDPNSAWSNSMMANMREGLESQLASTNMNMNRSLAARGMGGGNLRSLLSGANQNRMGEQFLQGQAGIANQGIGFGMQAAQLGNQALGMAGGFQQDAQNRLLNAATFNADANNQQNQFTMMSNYNQDLTNQQRRADFMSNMFGAGMSFMGGNG